MIIDHCSPADQEQLRRLWQQAFGDTDDFLDSFFTLGFAPERSLCARQDGQIAAAMYWFDCRLENRKLAYVYAVATDKDFRGKGICTTMMANAHQRLAQRGYAGAVLVPCSESLFRFYEKMGYSGFGGMEKFRAEAGAPVALQEISGQEYARLRRQYLPAGGILQEGPLMEVLATQAQFYQGTDFLLCCVREECQLTGLELLGQADAGGILGALGCQSGSFRVPGKTPFAMYLPLEKNGPRPDYFAFALD